MLWKQNCICCKKRKKSVLTKNGVLKNRKVVEDFEGNIFIELFFKKNINYRFQETYLNLARYKNVV